MNVIDLHYPGDNFIDGVKLGMSYDELEEIHKTQRKHIVGETTRRWARRLQSIMDMLQ